MKTVKKSLNVGHSDNNQTIKNMETKNQESSIKLTNSMKTKTNNVSNAKKNEVVNRIGDIYSTESHFEPIYQFTAFYIALSELPSVYEDRIELIFERYNIRETRRYGTGHHESEGAGIAIPFIDINNEVQEILEMANHPNDGTIIRDGEPACVADEPGKSHPYLESWGDKVYYSGKDLIKGFTPKTEFSCFIGENLLNRDKHRSVIITDGVLEAVALSTIDDKHIYLACRHSSDATDNSALKPDYQSEKIKELLKGRDVRILNRLNISGVDCDPYEFIYTKLIGKTPIEDVLKTVHEQTFGLVY